MPYTNHSLFSSADKAARFVRTPFQFDTAQDRARKILSAEVKGKSMMPLHGQVQRTGWLRGSLSYPWIFIAVGISGLVQELFAL